MADLTPKGPNKGKALNGCAKGLRDKLQEALSALDAIAPAAPAWNRSTATASKLDESDIRAILQARRNRARFFQDSLFSDPAWDILLELYAAELGQRRMATSRLSMAAGVPATTALRWISVLERAGLISREDDPLDRRRVYARLTQ